MDLTTPEQGAQTGRETYHDEYIWPERELSFELHYSGVSRRDLFSKAIRLGLYTCIICMYIHTYLPYGRYGTYGTYLTVHTYIHTYIRIRRAAGWLAD